MKLRGLRTIITGGSQGLGYHIARHFLAEGADVFICARSPNTLASAVESLKVAPNVAGRLFAETCDVSDEGQVRRVFSKAVADLGGVDVLVNCAGVAGPRGAFETCEWAAWAQAVQINLNGTALPCALVIPAMKKQGRGKIINLSGGGATKPTPHLSAYAATKAAVVRFTETLAVELSPFGIDVNAVAPGVLATKVVDEFLDVDASILGSKYLDEVRRQRENALPAFDKAADLFVYLASGASDGINGRLISAVWDPWPALDEHRAELAKSDVYTLRRITPEERGFVWGTPE